MSACFQCGKELTYNEIGAYKKFVNRGAAACIFPGYPPETDS